MGVGILNSKYLHMHLKKKNMSVFINERPRWLYSVFKFLNTEFIAACPKIVGVYQIYISRKPMSVAMSKKVKELDTLISINVLLLELQLNVPIIIVNVTNCFEQ